MAESKKIAGHRVVETVRLPRLGTPACVLDVGQQGVLRPGQAPNTWPNPSKMRKNKNTPPE